MNKQKTRGSKRHRPPAYYRYQERNPLIAIRLTKHTKDLIDKVKGAMSYREYINQLITDNSKLIENAYHKGFSENERLSIPCASCKAPVVITSKDPDWFVWKKKLLEAINYYMKVTHTTCK